VQGFCRPEGPSATRWPHFSGAGCQARHSWGQQTIHSWVRAQQPAPEKCGGKSHARVLPRPKKFFALTGCEIMSRFFVRLHPKFMNIAG
jgi:hypothetical protein